MKPQVPSVPASPAPAGAQSVPAQAAVASTAPSSAAAATAGAAPAPSTAPGTVAPPGDARAPAGAAAGSAPAQTSTDVEAKRQAPVSAEAHEAVKRDLEALEVAFAATRNGTLGTALTNATTEDIYGGVMQDIGKQVGAARSAFDRFSARGSLTQLEHDELRLRIDGAKGMLADPAKLRSDTVATGALAAVGVVGAGLVAAPAVVGGGLLAGGAKLAGALGLTNLAAHWTMEGANLTPGQAVGALAAGAVQGGAQALGGAAGGRVLGAAGGLVANLATRSAAMPLSHVAELAGAVPALAKAAPLVRDALKGVTEGSVGGATGAAMDQALRPETWKDGALEGAKRVLEAAGHGAQVGAFVGGVARPVVGALSGRPGTAATPEGKSGAVATSPESPPAGAKTPPAAEARPADGTPVRPAGPGEVSPPGQPSGAPAAGTAAEPPPPPVANNASSAPAVAGRPPGAGATAAAEKPPPPSTLESLSAKEQSAVVAARGEAFGPSSHPELAADFATVQRLEARVAGKFNATRDVRRDLAAARQRIEEARARVLAAPLAAEEQAMVLAGRIRAAKKWYDFVLPADVALVGQAKPVHRGSKVVKEWLAKTAQAQARIDAARDEFRRLRAQVEKVPLERASPERVQLLAALEGALRALPGGGK